MRKDIPEVVNNGDRIILPDGMSNEVAIDALMKDSAAKNKLVRVADQIECFPLDGIVALARVLKQVYGFTELRGQHSFFGERPPILVQVPTADGFETAPLGRMCPPKWEGGWLGADIAGPRITIQGEIKKKYEGEVKNIIKLTREELQTNSIYRGQAVMMDLSWYDNEDECPFDITKHSPKFMQLGETNLILNRNTQFNLEANILLRIERPEECLANGIPLKHGVLFGGTFGTGKSLTAKEIARRCVPHGWGFIYLTARNTLAAGLKIAKLMVNGSDRGVVVLYEDVEQLLETRDDAMNNLLNILDGVDTKDAPIITVLTTNAPERINDSALRAGRIDTVINFGPPDAETAERFVKHFAGRLIREGEDLAPVGTALAGLVPAFITEAINKAKCYAIYRVGKADITGEVTAEDLCLAATAVKEHLQMMKGNKGKTPEQLVAESVRNLHYYGENAELPVGS